MAGIEHRMICDGVEFLGFRDPKFKTARMSVHFLLPMCKEEASANALLPFLLSRASREYPDFTKLEQRLAELYGASLSADVDKVGDMQVLSVAASGLADCYALEGEPILQHLADLLCSVLFDPLLEDGLFPLDGFEQEKRQTIELIETELNEKRSYARQRCESLMCAEEPYGLSRYGTREEVAALERPQLTESWKRVVTHAPARVIVMGNCELEPLYERFCRAFRALSRGALVPCETHNRPAAPQVREVKEELPVAQAKLVMGFRTGIFQPQKEVAAMRMAMTNLRRHAQLQAVCERARKAEPLLLLRRFLQQHEGDRARAERCGGEKHRGKHVRKF